MDNLQLLINRSKSKKMPECGLGGWITEEDKVWLIEFLLNTYSEKDIIDVLELGCFQGGSSLIFLYALPSCRFYAADNWLGGPASPQFKDIKEGFIHNTKEYKDNITIFSGDSLNIGKEWDKELDLCYIDGCHDFPYPSGDIKYFSKWVKKDGFLLVDDYEMSDVKFAVDKLLMLNEMWRLIHKPKDGKIIAFQRVFK